MSTQAIQNHKTISLVVGAMIIMLLAVTLVFLVTQKQNVTNKTEWATYSVAVPVLTDNSRGEYFSFQYPKSEYIQLSPDMNGRLLRFQNYDPYTTSRMMDGRYSLEFFIDTAGHISCEQNVANGNTITNSQGTTMQKGQARQSEESGDGAMGIAACIERTDYVLYMQGSDYTGENIVEQMIDSVHYQE